VQRYVEVQHAVPLAHVLPGEFPDGCRRARQRGAYGVEFAAVFLAFFLTFYAVVTWGLIMTARQSLQVAVEEGARASLRYQAAGTDVLPQIRARLATACALVDRASNWIGSLSGQTTQCKATVAGTGLCVTNNPCCMAFDRNVPSGELAASACQMPSSGWTVLVSAVYGNYAAHPLVPVFPGFGPLLPTQLSAQAAIWIPPTSLDRGV